MHHQFANQELARLSYAEAIRNSSRHQHVVDDVEDALTDSLSLLERVREALANALAPAPAPRPSS
jgi:hypothetical protein